MADDRDGRASRALQELSDLLGVSTSDAHKAVATQGHPADVTTADGALSISVYDGGLIEVESPRAPGVRISLVDHSKDSLAPPGAVYEISAYTPFEDHTVRLGEQADVSTIYVGPKGIILCDSGKARVVRDS